MATILESPFKSIIVEDGNGGELRLDEGDAIEFTNEDGEVVTGVLVKITGKKSVKFTISPPDTQRQEIWWLDDIQDGSIKNYGR